MAPTYEFSDFSDAYDFYVTKFSDPDYDPYYDESDY
jgi:hypothetical protein